MNFTIIQGCRCITVVYQKVIHVVDKHEPQDPNVELNDNPIEKGFYKIEVLKCIVSVVLLLGSSERTKLLRMEKLCSRNHKMMRS
jgi:hypothetical protein